MLQLLQKKNKSISYCVSNHVATTWLNKMEFELAINYYFNYY